MALKIKGAKEHYLTKSTQTKSTFPMCPISNKLSEKIGTSDGNLNSITVYRFLSIGKRVWSPNLNVAPSLFLHSFLIPVYLFIFKGLSTVIFAVKHGYVPAPVTASFSQLLPCVGTWDVMDNFFLSLFVFCWLLSGRSCDQVLETL